MSERKDGDDEELVEPEVSAEELAEAKAEADAKEAEEKAYNNNVSRVKFAPASVKNVISKHKGAIIQEEGPLVHLSADVEEKTRKVFGSLLDEDSTVLPITRVPELLIEAGFTQAEAKYVEKAVDNLIDAKLDGDSLDVDAACKFAEKFQTPAYQYGQRLRRYAGRDCVEDVEAILARGCNPNAGDGEGLTALHYAAEFNKIEVIKTIRDVAGEALIVNAKCKYGWTPLHAASHHGNIESVELLLEMQADTEVPNKEQKTALHMAAAQGRIAICEMLIAAGAQVNAQDCHGLTPLHDAAYKGHEECLDALSAVEGADISIQDKLGMKPGDYLSAIVSTESSTVLGEE
jgi:hypothetical protein